MPSMLLLGVVSAVSFITGYFFNGPLETGNASGSSSLQPQELTSQADFVQDHDQNAPPQTWSVYENQQYNIRFRYPPSLTIEEYREKPIEKGPALLVRFIGVECAPTPASERGRVPSVRFFIGKVSPEEFEPHRYYCDQGPNCRERTQIGPIPLSDGLQAQLLKIFGVDSDAISLVISHSGLDYTFATGQVPTKCGEYDHYVKQMFEMANTFTFIDK